MSGEWAGFDADEAAFRARVQRDILDAYRPSWRWRLWYTLTLGRWRHRKQRAQLASLIAVSGEARQREAEYRAALPGRIAEVTAEVNERFAGVLPEGMRFEYVSSEDEA